VRDPAVGFLNLDGVARAHRIVQKLAANGYGISLASSSRGDALLRGNDILAGSVDVLICDSLTGNAIVKLLAAFTTGGRMEVSGSGYGPGVGDGAAPGGAHGGAPVGIISRASGAPVVANAILLIAKMVRAGLPQVYAEEKARAEKAGLTALLGSGRDSAGASMPGAAGGAAGGAAARPAKKTVQHEIDGIDVLEIDAAAQLLASKGIYCETAMGCTGPVVLVAAGDAAAAQGHLRDARLL
jgi:betaine reductase